MATWEDGPEYAPVERPSGFTEPPVEPLEMAPVREPAPAAPPVRPRDYAPEGSERPLSAHQPALGPTRDPSEPFEVARSTLTDVDSAWGLVHHYHVDADEWTLNPDRIDPRRPIHVGAAAPPVGLSPAPADGAELLGQTPVQAHWGPPTSSPPAPTTPVVTFGAVFNAVTVPTFATLLIGGLAIVVPYFSWLSPLMFILAFATATQIGYRRNWVRNTFLVASGALGATVVAGALLSAGNPRALLELVTAISTATCWIVLAALMVIMWQALSVGEQADHAPSSPRGWG